MDAFDVPDWLLEFHPHYAHKAAGDRWIIAQSNTERVVAFDRAGHVSWSRPHAACVRTIGVSDSGAQAFVVTCYSEGDPDSDMLRVLDFETGRVLWETEFFWEGLCFEGEALRLDFRVCNGGVEAFYLGPQGELPPEFSAAHERSEFEAKSANAWFMVPIAEDYLAEQPSAVDKAAEVLDKLEACAFKIDGPSWMSRFLKARGEIALARGDSAGAIQRFEEALKVNPKIGLKRRIAALKK